MDSTLIVNDENISSTYKTLFMYLARLCPKLCPIEKWIIKDGKIGGAAAIVAPAKETLDIMTILLKQEPILNLCDDFAFLWCRELERRLKLYNKIKKPKLFQKNILIRSIIALINFIRLQDSINADKIIRFMKRVESKI